MDLDRKSNAEHLVAYITTHHESHAYHGTTFLHSTPRQPVLGTCRGTAHQDTGRGMLPGLPRPKLIPFMVGGRLGYGGMLCQAATRPSTVYGGMPEGLFGCPIIP